MTNLKSFLQQVRYFLDLSHPVLTTFLLYRACFIESIVTLQSKRAIDWDDAETDLAHLGGAAPGAAKTSGDKLWEDNWDDDDVEEDFSVQLR